MRQLFRATFLLEIHKVMPLLTLQNRRRNALNSSITLAPPDGQTLRRHMIQSCGVAWRTSSVTHLQKEWDCGALPVSGL